MVWQSRPVFISSTFSDMQAERDHLRNHVFPALEERLKARRRHLEWVDLRLGVAMAGKADAQQRELQVLKVCLAEVQRCRPFLIVLLGDRYGWVPPAERLATAGFGIDAVGRSVTALEIRYGVLDDPAQQPRSFFYFREPLDYRQMPQGVAALYSDAHDTSPGASDRVKKLAALKQDIEQALPKRVRPYAVDWDKEHQAVTGLETWGRMVLEDIWSEISAVTPPSEREEQVSWQQTERDALDDYVEDRARDFVGRGVVLSRLVATATSPEEQTSSWGHCLTGDAGTGKSAIFGEVKRRLTMNDVFLLAHAAGASARSPSVDDMLQRWIEELSAALGTDPRLAERADPETVERTFHSLLRRMAAQRRVVVLIDALDQFEATTRARFVTWLPRIWPANARLIATTVLGDASKALEARAGIEMLPLPPLDATEARQIAEGICARYHRTLEPQVLEALLAKSGRTGPTWSNTLWLVLAVEELNLVDADDFARAKRSYRGTYDEQQSALMLDKVVELPPDIHGVYVASFDRAEELFGRALVRGFLGSIAISRAGWRESDFRVLLRRLFRSLQSASASVPWDDLPFASLRRLFRGQIRQRGALGQWDFNHPQMRVAVRQWLVAQRVSEIEFHAEIATHLLSLAADDPLRQSETMVHLLGSEDWTRASTFYGDQSLSQGEVDGATRVLADAVLTAGPSEEDKGLSKVHRLLDALARPRDASVASLAGTVAHRYLFNLNDMLDQRARLHTRGTLINGVQELLVRLAEAEPGNAVWQRYLAVSQEMIGGVLREQGDLSAALGAFRVSHKIFDNLAKLEPSNAGRLCELSVSNERLGDIYLAQGRLAEALREYGASLERMVPIRDREPPNLDLQRFTSVTYIKIGDVLVEQGNLPAALDSFKASQAIRDRLARVDPGNARWQHDLGISNERIGNVLMAQGHLAAALKAYEARQSIISDLAKTDPGKAEWQRDLSVSHSNIGNVLQAQGNFPAALDSYKASLAINDRLVKVDPDNAVWQQDLGSSLEKMGNVLWVQGNLPAAIDSIKASFAIRERLAKVDPKHAGWQRDLSASIERLGDIYLAQGRPAEALREYRASLERMVPIRDREPSNLDLQRFTSVTYIKIGDVLVEQGNLPEALESFRASLAIAERLTKADPGNAGWQRDLSVSHIKIGEVLVERSNLPAALDSFKASHEILDRLTKGNPGNAEWQADLAASHGKLGQLLVQMGRCEEALATFRKGRAIVAPLVAAAPDHAQWKEYIASFDREIAALARK